MSRLRQAWWHQVTYPGSHSQKVALEFKPDSLASQYLSNLSIPNIPWGTNKEKIFDKYFKVKITPYRSCFQKRNVDEAITLRRLVYKSLTLSNYWRAPQWPCVFAAHLPGWGWCTESPEDTASTAVGTGCWSWGTHDKEETQLQVDWKQRTASR